MNISVYLADQNPGSDRSYGISRMSYLVLNALQAHDEFCIKAITSKGSQQPPSNVEIGTFIPWTTTSRLVRLLADHIHPLLIPNKAGDNIIYYPKGYIPLFKFNIAYSIVTIHDTIIQYQSDHYPKWRNALEYAYWERMLKHSLGSSDYILTVSNSSKIHILEFMKRHSIPSKDIVVTYEPCTYETISQPIDPVKKDFVMHLASKEPHKKTAQLILWWIDAEQKGCDLPILHLIGSLPTEVAHLLTDSRTMVKRPFLSEDALEDAYTSARALILPSEIEGFGLPALEAYYLGTPVCYVKGTSVEEILSVASDKGGFSLDDQNSLFHALHEVMEMSADEVKQCGLILRETYAATKVAAKMMEVFQSCRPLPTR